MLRVLIPCTPDTSTLACVLASALLQGSLPVSFLTCCPSADYSLWAEALTPPRASALPARHQPGVSPLPAPLFLGIGHMAGYFFLKLLWLHSHSRSSSSAPGCFHSFSSAGSPPPACGTTPGAAFWALVLSLRDLIHFHRFKYHLRDNDFQICISSASIPKPHAHTSCTLTSPLR